MYLYYEGKKSMIELLIITLAIAAFSIQVAYMSTLADRIKRLFYVHRPPMALTQYRSWTRIIGSKRLSIILSPFILTLTIVFSVHKLVSDLLNCPYCLSYQLGWVILYFLSDYTLIWSLIYAALTLFWTSIIEKLIN